MVIPAGPLGGPRPGSQGWSVAGIRRGWGAGTLPESPPPGDVPGPSVAIADQETAALAASSAVLNPTVAGASDPEEARLGVDQASVVAVLGIARIFHARARVRRERGTLVAPLVAKSFPDPESGRRPEGSSDPASRAAQRADRVPGVDRSSMVR